MGGGGAEEGCGRGARAALARRGRGERRRAAAEVGQRRDALGSALRSGVAPGGARRRAPAERHRGGE